MKLNDIFLFFGGYITNIEHPPVVFLGCFFRNYWARGDISQPPGHFSRGLNLAQVQRQTDTIFLLMLEHNHADASIAVADVESFLKPCNILHQNN